MKLKTSNREDNERGFRLWTFLFNVSFHWWKSAWSKRSFALKIDIGGSPWGEYASRAGGGGRTFYFSHYAKGGQGMDMYVPRPWRIGFTGNSNIIPYSFGA